MPKTVKRIRRKRVKVSHPLTFGLRTGRLAVLIGAVIVGAGLFILLLIYAPRAYVGWREKRLLQQARESLKAQDFAQASRDARAALRLHTDSLPAFYILAEASEKQNKPETVAWRAQIARLQPRDLASQLNLASAALRFGQLDVARRALDNVPHRDRDRAAYHVVAGWLARAQGNEEGVEQHFAAAVAKEPRNNLYQYNLAVIEIRSDDPAKAAAARTTLERLSDLADFRTGSLRALLTDAVTHNDLANADHLAQELQMSQQVTFADYLLCLDFYKKLDAKKFTALLKKVKPVAAHTPADLALLMDWMNQHGLADDVLKWSEKLKAEETTTPPAAVSIAQALVLEKNWSRLRRWTRAGEWGSAEYLRLAYQAYACKQMRLSAAEAEFVSLWNSAESAAGDKPDDQAELARLATKWKLTTEAEQLWRQVAKNPPHRREALDALKEIYRARNDLKNLYQILQRLHEASPNEVGLSADLARLSLVTDHNAAEGYRLAREAYEKSPDELNAAVTYAFSLYSLGRTGEGIQILKKFTPDQLRDPHAAVYTAVLLLDNNQAEEAKPFIAAAHKGPIYPEEKQLLEEAEARNSAAPKAVPVQSPSATPTPGASP